MVKTLNLQSLQRLVRQGEGQTLEFKRKANFPDKIVREMVAFANTDGGLLLVGVDDSGKLSGVKHAEEERFVLEKAIQDYSRPRIKFTSHVVPLDEKRAILVYDIFKSRNRPHYALSGPKERYGKAFVRVEDESKQASREMVEILKGQRRRRGQKIFFGEQEKLLFKYLEKAGKITLNTYCQIAGLPEKPASKILVKLVLSNVLDIVLEAKEEYFVYKNQSLY